MANSHEKSHIETQQDEIETAKKEQRLRKLYFTKERRKKMEAKELEETKKRIWEKNEIDDGIDDETKKESKEESNINDLQKFTEKIAEKLLKNPDFITFRKFMEVL